MLLLPKLKRPKTKMRLKAKLWEMLMVPFTPSQNILQSSQKWKDILEYSTINLVATLWSAAWSLSTNVWRVARANCAPSECKKLAIKTEATINLNAWKEVVGANPAPSDWLNNKLELCVSFDSWDLGRTANKEVQLDSCWLGLCPGSLELFSGTESTINWLECFWVACAPSEYGVELNSTITEIRSKLVWAAKRVRMNATIRLSLELVWGTIIIAGLSLTQSSKRFGAFNIVIIAESFR